MSKGIGIYIGRSFIEMTSQSNSKRSPYSLNSIDAPIRSWLSTLKEKGAFEPQEIHVEMRTRLPWLVADRRIGNTPAFLTTAGLESWLDMNLPSQPGHWSVELKKSPSPLQKDLIFGISERMSAEGEALEAPPKEELEFLVEKLRLSEVTHLAVGFLHSQKNPAHEIEVAQFFREKGFIVYASHETSQDKEERPRFWSAVLNAYVDPFLKEKFEAIAKTFAEFEVPAGNVHFAGTPLPQFFESSRLWFTKKNRVQIEGSQGVLYCGLEDFELLAPACGADRSWLSIGCIGLPQTSALTLHPSPFQRLETNFWGALDWLSGRTDIDPGPICLGRGVHPTLIDAIATVYDLTGVDGLAERMSEKTTKKITDAFKAYAKSTHSDLLPNEELLKSSGIAWNTQLATFRADNKDFLARPSFRFKLVGPLAEMAHSIFKSLGIAENFDYEKDSSLFYLSQELVDSAKSAKDRK